MSKPTYRCGSKWVVYALAAVWFILLCVPGLAFVADGRNREVLGPEFTTVDGMRLNALVPGKPERGRIPRVRRDAWSIGADGELGRVWVVKLPAGDLKVFTDICPHMGCRIDGHPADAVHPGFHCVCHGLKFHLDGSINREDDPLNPAPRGLDTLMWRRHPEDPNLLQVVHQTFYLGRMERVARP
jgi:nitrite reductase/ring-hydroxylating ferredoxin subunit